jgi:hypothetical protein
MIMALDLRPWRVLLDTLVAGEAQEFSIRAPSSTPNDSLTTCPAY